jgi:hypothetical protein
MARMTTQLRLRTKSLSSLTPTPPIRKSTIVPETRSLPSSPRSRSVAVELMRTWSSLVDLSSSMAQTIVDHASATTTARSVRSASMPSASVLSALGFYRRPRLRKSPPSSSNTKPSADATPGLLHQATCAL